MIAIKRICILAVVFFLLLALFSIREYLDAVPHVPRLIFENGGTSDIAHLYIETASTRVDVGRVKSGGAVTLPVKPRAGEQYSIVGNDFSGDELIHYLEFARRDRTDVHLGVDQHGCGW